MAERPVSPEVHSGPCSQDPEQSVTTPADQESELENFDWLPHACILTAAFRQLRMMRSLP